MATLSLGMIVRNEERTLRRVLTCARAVCDQIVVVDTGSSDASVTIAKAFGAEVHHFVWVDDFAAARNQAFLRCTSDWTMWLDADDVVPLPALEALVGLKSSLLDDPHVHTVMCPYHLAWDAAGKLHESIARERLVRRTPTTLWSGRVHETLAFSGAGLVHRDDVWVEHRPHPDNLARKSGRNLAIYEAFIDVEKADPHTIYQYACELQWNDRPADAAVAFEVLFRRHGDWPEHRGESYLARIKAGECRVISGRPDLGMEHYRAAIRLDGARAEALCLAGELYAHQGKLDEAAECLGRAAAVPLPTSTEGHVFPWFYGERPRAALARLPSPRPRPATP